MKTENKIISLFIEEKTPKTIREISKKIKSDYRITHTATQRLLEKNILISKRIGKSSLCELNKLYYGRNSIGIDLNDKYMDNHFQGLLDSLDATIHKNRKY